MYFTLGAAELMSFHTNCTDEIHFVRTVGMIISVLKYTATMSPYG